MPDVSRLLDELLAESAEDAMEREQSEFDRQAHPFSTSIVLFGAARLGQLILAGLRRAGCEPLAFTDNNSALWGQDVAGIPVFSPADAARRFGDSAAFVIAIWGRGAPDSMEARAARLRQLGCRKVVPFGPLFWKYPSLFLPHIPAMDLPHKVLQQAGSVRSGFQALADERSRREFIAQLRWRLYCDFDGLPAPIPEPIYWPRSLVAPLQNEVYVDCGAYDGDTILSFLEFAARRFSQVIAFEPDSNSRNRMNQSLAGLPESVRARIRVVAAAAAAHEGTARFHATGLPSAVMGAGPDQVREITLDHELSGVAPTYIKMDIEGAEPDALSGAREILHSHAPVLAIAAYHLQDHLWTLPALIHSLNPDYRIFLRPHIQLVEDLVCYAVPPQRSLA